MKLFSFLVGLLVFTNTAKAVETLSAVVIIVPETLVEAPEKRFMECLKKRVKEEECKPKKQEPEKK